MDHRIIKRIFALLTLTVLTFTAVFYYNEINTDTRELYGIPPQYCMELRQKFSDITSSSIDIKNITEDLSALMRCTHIFNITQKEINRVRLHSCCNASGHLYFTKRNTVINESIPYETSKKLFYQMIEEVHNLLPQDFPWSKGSLRRCAVVGSGGILKNSSCGREIDHSDYVIRFNMAPINSTDVGLKTDLLTINPTQLSKYKKLDSNPDPLLERLSVYGSSSLILPPFVYAAFTRLCVNTLKVIHKFRPEQQVVFFSTSYLQNLARFWKSRGVKAARLSTGFMLINVALEVCDDVHVYGFWPFETDLKNQELPHHYFDNVGPKKGVHSMPTEFRNLLKLHSQGALTLHLQPCL